MLGHIPPKYSPAHDSIVQNYTDDSDNNNVQYVPQSFTTPLTAKAHRMFAPTPMDFADNPWLPIINWNEDYNSYERTNCGGVLVVDT